MLKRTRCAVCREINEVLREKGLEVPEAYPDEEGVGGMVMDIRFNEVNFAYQANTPFETRALFDLNFNIPSGKYTAIIGHTGSRKSTILQHLNALLKPTSERWNLGDRVVDSETSNKDFETTAPKVGIVFQFPESQLFEETVEKILLLGQKL